MPRGFLDYLPQSVTDTTSTWDFTNTVSNAMGGLADMGQQIMAPIGQQLASVMPAPAPQPEPPAMPAMPEPLKTASFSLGSLEDWGFGGSPTPAPRPQDITPERGSFQLPSMSSFLPALGGSQEQPPAGRANGPQPAAGQASRSGPLTIDRSSPTAFLGSLRPAAEAALAQKGYSASLAPILAAIPMNEQGWQKEAPGNNYFGIKGCFDATTEALTGRGWVSWPNVRADDLLASPNPYTGGVDYEYPTHLIRYHHAGPMLRFQTDMVDLLVTPNHRLWVRPSGSHLFRLMQAHDVFGRDVEHLHVPPVSSPGRVARIDVQPMSPFLTHVGQVVGLRAYAQMVGAHARAIVAAVKHFLVGRQSDAPRQLVRGAVGAQQASPESDLPVALGIKSGAPDPTGAEIGHVCRDRAALVDLRPEPHLERAETLAPAGAATAVRVAEVDLPRIGEEVMAAHLTGARDDTLAGHRSYPFGVTAPARSNGRGALVHSNCTRSEGWVPFDGMVYCATVPNGLLVVRRNGKAVVSGNSNPRTGANTGPVGTWEDYGQGRVNIQDTFRAYGSPAESVADFIDFLETNPRYAKAVEIGKSSGDPAAFIRAVHQAGYATDPAWSEKILSIARTVPASAPAGSPMGTPGQSSGQSNGQPAGAPAWGTYTAEKLQVNQISQGAAEGLTPAEALAVCGPAAAVAFARANGRAPTLREAKELGSQMGVWDAGSGMHGPASQVQLLEKMGVPSRLTEGADEGLLAREVQAGRPVIVDTPGHYYVAVNYDPQTRTFDFGESAKVLKASGGRSRFRLDELAGLGMGAPRATIFMGGAAAQPGQGQVR